MKQLISIIILFLTCVVQLNAQTRAISLDTILARIDRNNLQLQSYALLSESFRHSAEAATAWMPPMAGAGTFMTPYPWEKAMSPAEKGNIMIQVEQEIPNPAKLKARKKYIRSKGNATAAERDVALNELRSRAKLFYYQWLIAKNRIHVLSENDKLMKMMKKIEEVRYPYNQSKLSGIYLVNAKIEENINMMRMQEGIINRSRASLLTLMNADATEMFEIDSIAEPHFVPQDVFDTAALAAARKDVAKMDYDIRSMQLNIASMQAERKPDFRIRFDHMTPLAGIMPRAYSVMGMVSIPIAPWSSKMYKSEVKSMEYSIKAMEKQRSAMLRETTGMLVGMQAGIQSMHERVIGMEEKIIPALEKALDANFILYQENKLMLTEVLDSWEALNMMHMTLLDEKLKHYEMIVEYEKELFR